MWCQFYLGDEETQQSRTKRAFARVMRSQKLAVIALALANLAITVLLYRDGRYLISAFQGLDWFDPEHTLRYRLFIYSFVGIAELYLAFAAFCVIR